MSLELAQCLPDNLGISSWDPASMWELTEVDAVPQNFVDLLKEVSSGLAVRTAQISLRSYALVFNDLFANLSTISTWGLTLQKISEPWIDQSTLLVMKGLIVDLDTLASRLELELAEFAEKLVAALALQWLVWELEANDALNFFNHLSLELILNLVHLDVERWHWLWTHDLLNSPLAALEVTSLVDAKLLFLCVHFLEDWVHSFLLLVQILHWHIVSFKFNQI